MSFVNDQLIELFESSEFDRKRKIVISSVGTSNRNNLAQYLGLNDVLYSDVLPNPSLEQIIDFFRVVHPTENDIVVGIGGGSVIDFSKLVALFSETPIEEIKIIIETAQFHTIEKVLKLVIVPTLFGSGAEQTPFAVCYIGKKKYSVANDLILPARVKYIPEFNISAPSSIKLANVLDCFCQAAESLTASKANKVSINYGESALKLLVPIAKEYIEGNSIDLSANMAEASNLCGKAIAISKTTGPHAMSYFLTMKLSWPHGIAVGFSFLFFYSKYSELENRKVERLIKIMDEILDGTTLNIFFESLGFETKHLCMELLNSIDINAWLSSVNVERLSNGPQLPTLNYYEIARFYKNLLTDSLV